MIIDEQVKAALSAYFGRYADGIIPSYRMHDMRAALEAYEKSKWVNIDDRLPPLGEMVLAYRPNAHLSNDPHYKITFITNREQTSPTNVTHKWDCWCEVSHWMPLPEFKGVDQGHAGTLRSPTIKCERSSIKQLLKMQVDSKFDQ